MKSLILPSLLCAFIVSCATTPSSRIEKHPQKYANLPQKDKELVQQGRIDEGMHKDGVYLAMGKPDRITRTLENGNQGEEWNYYSLQPVYTQRFGVSIGIGNNYGYYGNRYRRSGWWYSPSIDYVPRLSAIVQFDGDQVDGYKIRTSQ